MATQLDILRQQAEAAARNAAAGAQGKLRRETSLVNQASHWAGRAMTGGKAAVQGRAAGRARNHPEAAGNRRAARPEPDGYVRRSPVQPLRVAEGYRRQRMSRAIGTAVVIAAICVGIWLLSQVGVFGR